MSSETLFGSTVLMLEKLLDLQSERHRLLSANIANVDTPGYKRYDLNFAEELKRAIGGKGILPLNKTHAQHLPLETGQWENIRGRLVADGTTRRRDGNTVDLDKEMAALAQNNLYYNAAVQLISKRMGSLRNAIIEVR